MSFDVYPGVGSGPLPLAPAAESEVLELSDHAQIDPASGRYLMFLNIVQINEGDGEIAPPPSIRLIADSGPTASVGSTPTPVHGRLGAELPAAVATQKAVAEEATVIEIEVLTSHVRWCLQIINTDTSPHRYTWAVGSTAQDARQPWLDILAGTVTFDGLPGVAQTREVPVANYGTGPLSLDDDGTDLGSGFELSSLTPRPIPANGRGTARLVITSAAGSFTQPHAFRSNDPTAGEIYGHNNRLVLTARIGPPPLWGAGDVLILQDANLWRRDESSGQLIPIIAVAPNVHPYLAVDPKTGDVVLLDAGVLKRVNRFTGEYTTLAHPKFNEPSGVAVHHDGTIAVADRQVDLRILRIPGGGGAPSTQTTVPGFSNLVDMAVDAHDDLILLQGGYADNGKVVRLLTSTRLTETVAQAGDMTADTGFTVSMALDGDGFVIVGRGWRYSAAGEHHAGSLIRVHPSNHEQHTIATLTNEPQDIAVAPDGTVLVVVERRVVAVTSDGRSSSPWPYSSVRRIVVVPPLSG